MACTAGHWEKLKASILTSVAFGLELLPLKATQWDRHQAEWGGGGHAKVGGGSSLPLPMAPMPPVSSWAAESDVIRDSGVHGGVGGGGGENTSCLFQCHSQKSSGVPFFSDSPGPMIGI